MDESSSFEERFGELRYAGASWGVARVAWALLTSPWLAGRLAPQPSDRDPRVLASRRRLAREANALHDLIQHLFGAVRQFLREDAMAEVHRHLPLVLAALGVLLCAILEAFAAYPAAAGVGLDLVVTAGIALVIVGAVVGLAALIAHSRGTRRHIYISLAVVLLGVLWAARFRYAFAFGDPGEAIASASGLSLVSLMVLVVSHELWHRAEPVSRWQARRAVRRTAGAVDKAVDRVRQAADDLQRVEDGYRAQAHGDES